MSDRLAEIKERLAMSRSVAGIDEPVSAIDWYERDVSWLTKEIERLRAERPVEKELLKEALAGLRSTGCLCSTGGSFVCSRCLGLRALEGFARRAGLIE